MKQTRLYQTSNAGFSLIELIAVTAIAGLLAAIVAPGWLAFVNSRNLNTAQDQVFQAMRQAQQDAQRHRIREQVSFRQASNGIEWATHPVNAVPQSWQTIPLSVQISDQHTTLARSGQTYRVQFDEQGNVNGQLGRLTLAGQGSTQRCVFVSTLLGALRKAQNRSCQV